MGFLDIPARILRFINRHPRWVKTILMVGFLFFGLITAIGHHVFYHKRDGQLVGDQRFDIRVGTALAFLTKAMLSAAVAIALTQIIWQTVRRQPFTLVGLDHLFAISSSPTNLISFEVIRQAWVVSIVAICFWLIPFAAIAPPGTLTVHSQSFVTNNSTVNAPSFDFQGLAKSESPSANAGKVTLSITSSPGATFDSYNGPTNAMTGLAAVVAYGKKMLTFSSPCGANCSYPLTFAGPAIKCQNMSWNDPQTPWYSNETDHRLFDNRYQYYGNGTEKPENVFWAAWAYLPHVMNGTVPGRAPTLGGLAQLYPDYVLSAVKCSQYNATYKVNVRFTSNQGAVDLVSVQDLGPFNFTLASDSEMFINANDTLKAGDVFAAKAIYDTLFGESGLVAGSISEGGGAASTTYVVGSNIVQTALTEEWIYYASSGASIGKGIDAYFPVKDLGAAIEELHRNVTFSIMARPDIVYSSIVKTRATISNLRNVYKYDPRDLWLSYGAAIVISAAIVVFGLLCLWRSGDAHDTAFSSILLAASNPHLDRVLMGAQAESGRNTGAVEYLKDVKLQYRPRSEEGHYYQDGTMEGFVIVDGAQNVPHESSPLASTQVVNDPKNY